MTQICSTNSTIKNVKYHDFLKKTTQVANKMTRLLDSKLNCSGNEGYEIDDDLEKKLFFCSICGKNFPKKADLTVHLDSHNISNDDRKAFCNICCKNLSAKRNLIKHLRKVHKNFEEAEKIIVKKLKCPETNCQFICRMMKDLRDHIEKSHNIKILRDALEFSSETEFQGWKKEEETNTVSLFISGRMKVTCADGSKKQILYCHRTGHYIPKGQGKYRMKSKGSCKIGVTCPATMEVTELPNGQLTVIYYKTHLGHSQDLVYLKLSREERAQLARKIEQGFTFDSILEDVKECNDLTITKKKRIHLLTRKDLHNLSRDVNKNIERSMKKKLEVANNKGPQIIINNVMQKGFCLKDSEGERRNDNYRNELETNTGSSFALTKEVTKKLELNETQCNTIQPSGEGVTSQIVILSPDVNYTSDAEVILLPAGDSAPQQSKNMSSKEIPQTSDRMLSLEEKGRINRPNLRLQIKNKLDKIIELLPKSEYLTPKQFEWVNNKLDGILSVFNEAEAKVKTRQKTLLRKAERKGKMSREEVKERKVGNQVLNQPVFVSPLVYAVYN